MGYEDLNDHEELRHDPMFALALFLLVSRDRYLDGSTNMFS